MSGTLRKALCQDLSQPFLNRIFRKLLGTAICTPILQMKGALDLIPPVTGTERVVKTPNCHI